MNQIRIHEGTVIKNQIYFSVMKAGIEVVGYLHVLMEKVELANVSSPIHANISLGEIAKVNTTPKPSGANVNEVFLIEVPKDPSRLRICGQEGERDVGECRYDVNPFFEHEGSQHTIESDLFNDDNEKVGSVKLKVTFYPSRHGKLRVRIFHLQFHPTMVEQFKEAKIKVRFGIHAQSTSIRSLSEPFDEVVEMLVLSPTASLTFDVVHEQGILGSYKIKNAQEEGILNPEPKAFQVSVFNNDKAVGLIKYQLDWLHKKPA